MPPTKAKLPCVCGNKLLHIWSGFGHYTMKCDKCGMEVYGNTKIDVIEKWNDKVKGEKGKA